MQYEGEFDVASVRIEDIVDHLDSEFSQALASAVRSEIPDTSFDEYSLFREFSRAVGQACMTWERVPDQYVKSG